MPTIKFLKGRPSLEVPVGTNLMQALQADGVVVASSCRGDGICRKCRLAIPDGFKNLSAVEPLEKQWRDYDEPDKLTRLSCQVLVLGDITVDATYW